MNTFINDFKKTSYYDQIVSDKQILGIFLVGSRCLGTATADSDYDLQILTMADKYIDVAEEKFLCYKGKKVHWHYFPIKDLFNFYYNDVRLLCPIQLQHFLSDFIIYQNELYKDIFDKLVSIKETISKLATYKLYDVHKARVNTILKQRDIKPLDYSKILYHLCISTYYLIGKTPDISFLCDIKNHFDKSHIDQIIWCLETGVNYIDTFPIDYKKELNKIYKTALG